MRYLSTFESLNNIVYRIANNQDYVSIKKIANQHREYLPFVMRVAIEDSIKRDEVLVAECNNRVVGFLHFHKRRDGYTTVHEIGIDREYQSMGIGKKLLSYLEKPIQLKVTKDNQVNEFYKRLGFKFIKEVEGTKRVLNLYVLR